MSFVVLPNEMQYKIVEFVKPEKFSDYFVSSLSLNSLKSLGRELASVALTNRELHEICIPKRRDLKRLFELVGKYRLRSMQYRLGGSSSERHRDIGNPELYTALLSGCKISFANYAVRRYSQEVEADIEDMIRLTPQSINCRVGKLRQRENVSPLFAACINPYVPMRIIKLLIDHGANPNEKILLNGEEIPILDDLLQCISAVRYSLVKQLFQNAAPRRDHDLT